MFATGIENSIPTINHGKTRVDQMESSGHYERWREDFDCVQEIGINFLRYGPPLHRTFIGPNQFDWAFADLTLSLIPSDAADEARSVDLGGRRIIKKNFFIAQEGPERGGR
jgi:hypothetical protein